MKIDFRVKEVSIVAKNADFMYTDYYSQHHKAIKYNKTIKYNSKEAIELSILPFFWEMLVNIVENVIYALLFMKCLTLHRNWVKYKVVIFLMIVTVETALACLCKTQNIDSIFAQLLMFVTDCVVILRIFKDTLVRKLIVAVSPALISILADKFTFVIGDLVAPGNVTNFIFEGYYHYCSTLIYLCFCVLLYFVFENLFQGDIYLTSFLRLAIYLTVILIIIFTNSFLDIIMSPDNFHVPTDMRQRIQSLSIGFILIILLLIYLIPKTGQVYKRNLDLENQLHQEQLSKIQLDLSMQSMANVRSWKHDYKNHLTAMMGLLHEEKYMELSEYLDQLQAHSSDYFSNVSSGNASIDAIVTSKMQLARQAGVDFQHSIMLPMTCPLTDLELTAILGNLLDNSLEACGKIALQTQKAPPCINLTIKPFRHMLQIQVVNSSDGKYNFGRGGKLCTTKENTSLHGYGLKRIARIVENTGGILNIQPEEDRFAVNIFIPISEKKEA